MYRAFLCILPLLFVGAEEIDHEAVEIFTTPIDGQLRPLHGFKAKVATLVPRLDKDEDWIRIGLKRSEIIRQLKAGIRNAAIALDPDGRQYGHLSIKIMAVPIGNKTRPEGYYGYVRLELREVVRVADRHNGSTIRCFASTWRNSLPFSVSRQDAGNDILTSVRVLAERFDKDYALAQEKPAPTPPK